MNFTSSLIALEGLEFELPPQERRVNDTQATGPWLSGKLHNTDPVILERTMLPWEVICRPLAAGRFSHEVVFLKGPSWFLYHERYSILTHIQGMTPAGMLGVMVPIQRGSHSSYWHQPAPSGALMSTLPGIQDVQVDSGDEQALAFVKLSLLHERLPAEWVKRLIHAASSKSIPLAAPQMEQFRGWITGILRLASEKPHITHNPAVMNVVEEELLQILGWIASHLGEDSSKTPVTTRQRAVEKSIAFIRDAHSSSLNVHDLCRYTGISQRSLEAAFREALELTPTLFLRQWRLHRVRQNLLMSSPQELSVTEAALQEGFHHLGRFSVRYRQLFGEKPSETLARSAPGSTVIDLRPTTPSVNRYQKLPPGHG